MSSVLGCQESSRGMFEDRCRKIWLFWCWFLFDKTTGIFSLRSFNFNYRKKKTQNSFSKYLKSLTPDKKTSTRKEFKNFAASTTPMNQHSELEPNANNFSPKDLNEAVSSNNLSNQSSESLADSPSKNTTSTVKCYQKLSLVEVPIKAKVECVQTQKLPSI